MGILFLTRVFLANLHICESSCWTHISRGATDWPLSETALEVLDVGFRVAVVTAIDSAFLCVIEGQGLSFPFDHTLHTAANMICPACPSF